MAYVVFFFQAEDGIRDHCVTGVQTCALPISHAAVLGASEAGYSGDCRGCAESFGAAIWPGRVGRGGPAVSSLVSVSRRPAGSAGESAADQSASAPSEIEIGRASCRESVESWVS